MGRRSSSGRDGRSEARTQGAAIAEAIDATEDAASGRAARPDGSAYVPPSPPSFAAIAEQHLDDVLGYLVYLTADHSLAEDLTVETFERALRRFGRFDPRRGGARTWLCQLARSAALDHFRSEGRRVRREDRYAVLELREVPPPSFGEGLSPELEHALAELSRAEREVVALRVVLELDGETTARVLGISPSACSTRLSRALQKLEGMVSADAVA